MKLFKAALGNTEQDKALSREKFFNEEFGELAAEWNQRLISSGMEPDQALDQYGRRDLPDTYSAEQEHQFALYARWSHKAQPFQFQTGRGDNIERNRRIWNLFANGFTVREIGKELDLDFRRVNEVVKTLQDRCHEDTRNGLLDADKDSRSEINEWTRLQAIKQKHLQLLASGSLASTIVDSIIDSGVLQPRPLDAEIVDAFNEVSAQLALALEVSNV